MFKFIHCLEVGSKHVKTHLIFSITVFVSWLVVLRDDVVPILLRHFFRPHFWCFFFYVAAGFLLDSTSSHLDWDTDCSAPTCEELNSSIWMPFLCILVQCTSAPSSKHKKMASLVLQKSFGSDFWIKKDTTTSLVSLDGFFENANF